MPKQKSKQAKKPKLNAQTIIEELKAPALMAVGLIGGNFAGKMIDKAVPVDETATGFQAKALIKPLVQLTAGLGGAIFLKDKNIKLIAGGIAISGVASSVKVFLKKDILSGLGDVNLGETVQKVFREPVNLSIGPYNPDLPALSAPSEPIQEIPIEEIPLSMGELSDYQEVQEIQIL